MWIWPPVIQRELDKFRFQANNHRVRKQKHKQLPSGVTPSIAYSLPEKFGTTDMLQPVDVNVINEMLDQIRGEDDVSFDWGVPDDFAKRAQEAFKRTGILEVTVTNAWFAF